MAEKKMKLSIIILSWNTAKLLSQCLESIINELTRLRINGLTVEIIVVDNGSSDGSVEMLRKLRIASASWRIELKIIENKENLGFTKGNNIGIKEAKGEYIMLLNSDTIVREGAIKKLVEFLDNHPDIDIVGPKLLNTDGSSQSNCGQFPNLGISFIMLFKEHFGGSNLVRTSPNESKEVDWLMGAAFMARRKVFDEIGGLDENIFMYMEEVEWFYRAQKAGFKSYFLKEAEITHMGRGSSKSGKTEPILNIYKGLLYFYKKHFSVWDIFLLKIMLKTKALLSIILGYLTNNNYLKETYGQAIRIN